MHHGGGGRVLAWSVRLFVLIDLILKVVQAALAFLTCSNQYLNFRLLRHSRLVLLSERLTVFWCASVVIVTMTGAMCVSLACIAIIGKYRGGRSETACKVWTASYLTLFIASYTNSTTLYVEMTELSSQPHGWMLPYVSLKHLIVPKYYNPCGEAVSIISCCDGGQQQESCGEEFYRRLDSVSILMDMCTYGHLYVVFLVPSLSFIHYLLYFWRMQRNVSSESSTQMISAGDASGTRQAHVGVSHKISHLADMLSFGSMSSRGGGSQSRRRRSLTTPTSSMTQVDLCLEQLPTASLRMEVQGKSEMELQPSTCRKLGRHETFLVGRKKPHNFEIEETTAQSSNSTLTGNNVISLY